MGYSSDRISSDWRPLSDWRPRPGSLEAWLDSLPRGGVPDAQDAEGMEGDYGDFHVVVESLIARLPVERMPSRVSAEDAAALPEAKTEVSGGDKLVDSLVPAAVGELVTALDLDPAAPSGSTLATSDAVGIFGTGDHVPSEAPVAQTV